MLLTVDMLLTVVGGKDFPPNHCQQQNAMDNIWTYITIFIDLYIYQQFTTFHCDFSSESS